MNVRLTFKDDHGDQVGNLHREALVDIPKDGLQSRQSDEIRRAIPTDLIQRVKGCSARVRSAL